MADRKSKPVQPASPAPTFGPTGMGTLLIETAHNGLVVTTARYRGGDHAHTVAEMRERAVFTDPVKFGAWMENHMRTHLDNHMPKDVP